MNGLIYLIGLIVVIMFILSFLEPIQEDVESDESVVIP